MSSTSILTQPLKIGSIELKNRLFLAPLSGITDLPMRRRADKSGAGLTVCEMIASGQLAHGNKESRRRMKLGMVKPSSLQLAGRDVDAMVEAAKIAADNGAQLIDINMGCPAKKVVTGACGSALMKVPELALDIIENVVRAVDIPVTVKMRLGWDENDLNAPMIAKRAQDVGVQMITVHGRTRCQFYQGRADWDAIKRVREAITIPLVANGDVETINDCAQILHVSGADAIMIGRAHYGRPWLIGSLLKQLGAEKNSNNEDFSTADLIDYVREHYEDMLHLYGQEQGLRKARKHLGWYLDRHTAELPASLRRNILTASTPQETMNTFARALETYATKPEFSR